MVFDRPCPPRRGLNELYLRRLIRQISKIDLNRPDSYLASPISAIGFDLDTRIDMDRSTVVATLELVCSDPYRRFTYFTDQILQVFEGRYVQAVQNGHRVVSARPTRPEQECEVLLCWSLEVPVAIPPGVSSFRGFVPEEVTIPYALRTKRSRAKRLTEPMPRAA